MTEPLKYLRVIQ